MLQIRSDESDVNLLLKIGGGPSIYSGYIVTESQIHYDLG